MDVVRRTLTACCAGRLSESAKTALTVPLFPSATLTSLTDTATGV